MSAGEHLQIDIRVERDTAVLSLHGELDLVGMEMNGDALSKWLHDPERQKHSSHPGDSSGD